MDNIDLKKISELLANQTGHSVQIEKIEKVGSGYHSDGFKLVAADGRCYFLKKVKSHDLGFELPERKIMSLLVSNGMCNRANIGSKCLGVVLGNGDEVKMLPEVNEATEIYHLQEYEPEGTSYWSLLQARKNRAAIEPEDLSELEKITDYISAVHRVKHPSSDAGQLKAVYNDSLRAVLTNPELAIMLLSDYTDSHPLLPAGEHGAYVGLMLNLMYQWKDRSDRLTALHGDFWGANLFVRKDGSVWMIDYSRIPWGDPGIDIGWWLAQYIWFYHATGNQYFKTMGDKFLELYIAKTNDQEIKQTVALSLGLLNIIFLSPRFYPDLDLSVGKSFFDNIVAILKKGTFIWTK
ncbi:MAG: hypothetical protein PHD72_01505 [Patescibacteria group bacterium]|nr:hypothetical protein [Patescibacteria group bacterium]